MTIPPPTDEDRAIDLQAEYAASDRDAMRRALIRLAWDTICGDSTGEWVAFVQYDYVTSNLGTALRLPEKVHRHHYQHPQGMHDNYYRWQLFDKDGNYLTGFVPREPWYMAVDKIKELSK